MSVIKPGKLGPMPGARRRTPEENLNTRDIWDDYAPPVKRTKSKRKQEFEIGAGNKMVAKPRAEMRQAPEAVFDEDEAQKYQPRTDYETLEAKLGYEFKDRELLVMALTHRSALGIKDRADYERLEFLGDAVLDLVVAHLLSDTHPEAREGELSKMRAALVNTQALAQVATELEIGDYIRLGRGEFSSGGTQRPSILADVMEAVVGAMYRDSDFDTSMRVVSEVFGDNVEQVNPFDPKTELQEVLHLAGSDAPSYLLEMVEGPEHAPTFVTVVMVDGEIAGRGRGNTKKASQQDAAAEALSRMIPRHEMPTLKDGQRSIIGGALFVAPAAAKGTTA